MKYLQSIKNPQNNCIKIGWKIIKVPFKNSSLFGPYYVKSSNNYIITFFFFVKGISIRNLLKINLIKNRWIINYLYLWKCPIWSLWASFFCYGLQIRKKLYKLCREPPNNHSYKGWSNKFGCFQRRRLTCKSLRTSTSKDGNSSPWPILYHCQMWISFPSMLSIWLNC